MADHSVAPPDDERAVNQPPVVVPTDAASATRRRRAGGRPRRRPEDGVQVQVNFKLSERERERIRNYAEQAGLSVSAYLRRRALGLPVVALAEMEDRRAARQELVRVGTNLNQLARRAHEASTRAPAEGAALLVALTQQARAAVDEVRAAAIALRRTRPAQSPSLTVGKHVRGESVAGSAVTSPGAP